MRLFVVALTATMLATGGFGMLPKNPITRAAQEQIGENLPEPFLGPVNAYLKQISAPTIESRPRPTNGSIDPVGWILAGLSSETPEVATPASTSTLTSVPISPNTTTPAVTPSQTSTATLTASPSATITITPTPNCPRPSTTPAVTTFFNSSALTIDVYLVDPACKLILYFTLGPKESVSQQTTIGQFWWFIESSAGRLLADHLVASANESVDVSTGAVSLITPTPTPFGGLILSNVVLTDDLYSFGTTITLVPGQEFYVSYDFQVSSNFCPTCSIQLVTGLGSSDTNGSACAYAGIPDVAPGASGTESATLIAPSSPGAYAVVVEYHQRATCGDALSNYGTGAAVFKQVIGEIIVLSGSS
ncbi:MAG TPA: hypothetical protein PLA27_15255 [Anaerolineales bacterium]|nr:hypothetical protein [Anaerolineales bacterium]HQX17779.1 hypothetical protein [Anaerolineales bacterium]